jgi:thioredoxin-related protein
MKRIIGLLLLTLVFTPALAQEGVEFYQGDWEGLKQKAQESGKPFFVDFKTSWCGWCKVMNKKTFSHEKVGQYANENYIAYRIDAEKGKGPKLARKYKVRGYPTIVFFNSEGEKVKTVSGYQGPDAFLSLLKRYKDGSGRAQGSIQEPGQIEDGARVQDYRSLKNAQMAGLKKKSLPVTPLQWASTWPKQ